MEFNSVKKAFKLACENCNMPVKKTPATVHQVFAHAGEVIIHSPAPLSILVEVAAESQHKK